MSITSLDRRTTPARQDRAAAHLSDRVDAAIFVDGEARTVMAPLAPLRREPRLDCSLDTEAIRGETATVYEDREGWAWVQLAGDDYVGYAPSSALGPYEPATHKVAVLRTLVFPGPNLKLPITASLTLGAVVAVRTLSGGYAELAEGWVWASHLAPLAQVEPDFVTVAERFLGVPYLWGGKSSLGLDCSGLVQVALAAAGRAAPRDSDMQESACGPPLPDGTELRRGDLVFWRGHVGIMRDPETLLHANAHAMMVSSEPLAEARQRIATAAGAAVTAIKRLSAQPRDSKS